MVDIHDLAYRIVRDCRSVDVSRTADARQITPAYRELSTRVVLVRDDSEATETLPTGMVSDMMLNLVQTVAVRPSDLVSDKVRLHLRVELSPPEIGKTWSACCVLAEGRTVEEVVEMLADPALPTDEERSGSGRPMKPC